MGLDNLMTRNIFLPSTHFGDTFNLKWFTYTLFSYDWMYTLRIITLFTFQKGSSIKLQIDQGPEQSWLSALLQFKSCLAPLTLNNKNVTSFSHRTPSSNFDRTNYQKAPILKKAKSLWLHRRKGASSWSNLCCWLSRMRALFIMCTAYIPGRRNFNRRHQKRLCQSVWKLPETCLRHRLISVDAVWKRASQDVFCHALKPLTRLFAMTIVHCEPSKLSNIFEELIDFVIIDFQNQFKQ